MPEWEEKSYPATPRRRRRAKRRGEVAKSTQLSSALVLVSGIILLKFTGNFVLKGFFSLSRNSFSNLLYLSSSPQNLLFSLRQAILYTASHILPFFLLIMIAGIIVNIAQTGFVFTFHPLIPDLKRINPVEGIKRIFSLQGLVRLLISVAKLTLIGYLAYMGIKGSFPLIFSLTGKDVGNIFFCFLSTIFNLCLFISMGIIPVVFADYMFQKIRYERRLRMSREELKEEQRQTEGDPLVKSRIRSLQRRILKYRMMQKVPTADVVITNPRELAVALQYEREKMNAPVVIAKGAGFIAEKIKEIARKHNVPLVENKYLARMLYKSVEIGQEIPFKFYKAVAEILAYVYRIKKKRVI